MLRPQNFFCRKEGSAPSCPGPRPSLYKACSPQPPPLGSPSRALTSAGRNAGDKLEITPEGRAGPAVSRRIKPAVAEATKCPRAARGWAVQAEAATSTCSSSDMNPQAALSQALLLLGFLHLSLLSGHSHPLGGPSRASDLPRLQELLDLLQDMVSRLQAEWAALELHQQGQGPVVAWEAEEAAPASGLPPPRVTALQALPEVHSSKKRCDSGCFGQRLDQIGSRSSLGCTVRKKKN
ncbi:natriuretic peptides B [Tamandua tetradactyla]|uniref:natriuretic peptides B n=1 Tax=Tamandua tetradactyla TaxID=48850 RepID=UPI0040548AE7